MKITIKPFETVAGFEYLRVEITKKKDKLPGMPVTTQFRIHDFATDA